MKPYQQLTAIIFAAIGVFMTVEGYRLKLEGEFGPGPGFMAFFVGALLLVVSLVWLARVSLQPAMPFPADMLPEDGRWVKVIAVTVAMLAFATLLQIIGFKLSAVLFLAAAFLIFGLDHLIAKAIVALAGSFGLAYVFEHFLLVPLPKSSIAALAGIGL